MLLENVPMGRTMEVHVIREDYHYRLISKVEDVNSHRVCMTAIASNGRFFNFKPEDKVRLVYRDQENMWEWNRVKVALAKLDGIPVHYFEIRDQGRSINRRDAYRVKLLEETLIGFYTVPGKQQKYGEVPPLSQDEEKLRIEENMSKAKEWERFLPKGGKLSPEEWARLRPVIEKPTRVPGIIRDISENGAGIFCNVLFEPGDGIFFDIPSSYGNLPVQAQIVRRSKLKQGNSQFAYYYGCGIVKSDQKLLRYIYDVQRKILKKQSEEEANSGFE